MADEVKIGLIGLDTSHCIAFTKTLNDEKNPERVSGGKVVWGFPAGSKDFELSISRVPGYVKQLREEFGIQIMETPEAVAEAADVVFIMSCDGRVHREHFEKTAKFKKPTFIDKPMTTNINDAKEIFKLAQAQGIPLMSCSSLRYAQGLTEALAKDESGAIVGCDMFGPMAEQAVMPGLFWYGIHTVEMLETVMGPGCRVVRATKNDDAEMITCTWADGRLASMRGTRKGHSQFGGVIHREKGVQMVDPNVKQRSYYAGMLEAILRSLPNGKSDVPMEQTLEVIRIIEAANESRQSGTAVQVA
jgi:predicted dehydrogenase